MSKNMAKTNKCKKCNKKVETDQVCQLYCKKCIGLMSDEQIQDVPKEFRDK